MFIDRKFSQQLEGANAHSHRAYTGSPEHCLPLSSGGAFFSGNDDFFSQVVGWGFSVSESEIEKIEAFYTERACPKVAIEYSILASMDILNLLVERGYRFSEFNNVSTLNLASFSGTAQIDEIDTRLCEGKEIDQWSKAVAEGFGFKSRWKSFERYGKTEGIYPFGAFVKGQLAGGGAIAIYDGICDLGMTSTLSRYRGKGVQKALLRARLKFAQEQRSHTAVVNIKTLKGLQSIAEGFFLSISSLYILIK